MRTSESWKRKKDKPEEKTEISEIDAPAIVGGKLVCRVGELKANSYHFIQTKKSRQMAAFLIRGSWVDLQSTITPRAPLIWSRS